MRSYRISKKHKESVLPNINLKWLQDVHVTHGTIKLLAESTDKTFPDINPRNVLLGQSPKPIEIKSFKKKILVHKIFEVTKSFEFPFPLIRSAFDT